MSFFSKILNLKSESYLPYPIQYGRHNNGAKSGEKNQVWEQALAYFEQKEYFKAYLAVLDYLGDPELENLKIIKKGSGKVHFDLLQGSKVINGFVNEDIFYAEAKVCAFLKQDTTLNERLLKQNYNLRYSRFAIDSNDIVTLVFQSEHIDASPYKIYYGLKEIAVIADGLDDLLVADYSHLIPVNTSHIKPISDNEKMVKYQYFLDSINTLKDYKLKSTLDFYIYPGALAYMVLGTSYLLDYLLKPEGRIMGSFQQIHATYFKNSLSIATKKNDLMCQILLESAEINFLQFSKEIYSTINTFGHSDAGNHSLLSQIIESELPNMEWYLQNEHLEIARSIPTYIVGYALFAFDLSRFDKALLHLFFQVYHFEFFEKFRPLPYVRKGVLSKKEILKSLDNLNSKFSTYFEITNFRKDELDFSSNINFAKSYLSMIQLLDFQTIKVES
jgi:hypothetical protein